MPRQYFGVLLDWVIAERERRSRASRSLIADGAEMPQEDNALLSTLDAVPESWMERVWQFGSRIRNAVGRSASLT